MPLYKCSQPRSGSRILSCCVVATLCGLALTAQPTNVSVNPSNGIRYSQTFAFTAATNSPYTVTGIWGDFNTSTSGVGACYFLYESGNNTVYLLNDAGNSWSPLVLGSSGTASNSQCILTGTTSYISGAANNLTLNLDTTFQHGFAGAWNIYSQAADSSNLTSNWQQVGTWTVPVYVAPTNISVSPTNQSGSIKTFAFTAASVNGYGYVSGIWGVFNSSNNGVNACYFIYEPGNNSVYLLNDAGNSWNGMALGSGTVGNSQCSFNGAASSITVAGNNLTLNLAITFTSAFMGAWNIYTMAADYSNLTSPWQQMGTWTVPLPAPTITSGSPLPTATINMPYSVGLTASGGSPPYTWGLTGNLPPGFTLSSSTGVISGTATGPGNFPLSISVRDSLGTYGFATLTLPVVSGGGGNPPTVTTSSPLPIGVTSASYSKAFSAAGGVAPYTWSVAGGLLPGGISFSSQGVLSGMPQAQGPTTLRSRSGAMTAERRPPTLGWWSPQRRWCLTTFRISSVVWTAACVLAGTE